MLLHQEELEMVAESTEDKELVSNLAPLPEESENEMEEKMRAACMNA